MALLLKCLDPAPGGDTTAADSHDVKVTALVDDGFQFGSVGADDSTAGDLSIGFWFPGTEGEVTYAGNTYPKGQVHAWRSRFHPLKQGRLQAYTMDFRFGQNDSSLPDFYSRDWRWAWSLLKPAASPQNIELLRQSIIDMLAGRVEMPDHRAEVPNFIDWGRRFDRAPTIDRKAVMGVYREEPGIDKLLA